MPPPALLPPTNLEAEVALLGGLLVNNKARDYCGGLEPEHFYDDINREIYRAAIRRIEAGKKADAVSLKGLAATGLLDPVGGVAYLVGLVAAMIVTPDVSPYAEIIRDCAVRRQLIEAADGLRERAYGTDLTDGDGLQTAAWAIAEIERAAAIAGSQGTTMGNAAEQAIAQSEAAQRGDKGASGLLTGIDTLDNMWAGLYPGSLDLIGARPRTGKTSLACQIGRTVARQLAKDKAGCVAFLSLEMQARDLGLVNLASMTGIPSDDIRRGRYDEKQAWALVLAKRELAALPIEIIDRPRIPLMEAIGILRSLKRRKGLRLAIIDHRNLFGRDPDYLKASTLDWYSNVTRRLKDAAKMLEIPIICLVQISRGSEGREDPRPTMADLEYSGEQDCDNLILLYRQELHMGGPPPKKPNETEEAHSNKVALWHQQRRAVSGKAEAIFCKRRFGPTGICQLKFEGTTTTFESVPFDDPGYDTHPTDGV